MQILSEMLYSRSGELYNELYSKKLISQDLDSAVEHSANYSFTVVSSESNEPEAVYDHFVSFVKRTKQKGLDKEAFELAKRTIYAVNIKLFDSTDDIAEALMTTYLEGGELFEIPDIIASIDYDYIVELFNSQYNEDYFAMSIVNPITKDKEE